MKKYLVIGNPISHSLSPELHNYWLKKYNINAVYNKKKINEDNIKDIITRVRDEKIHGINVTVPFKKSIIPFLDRITPLAKKTQSVNTIFKKNNKVIGDNTDVGGFKKALKYTNYNVKKKKALILGAGGVAPSIILSLKELGIRKITLSNRTKKKAEDLKKKNPNLQIINWDEICDCNYDIFINATSIGLKTKDKINLGYFIDQNGSNFKKKNKVLKKNKLFYDVIYNPKKTNFLLEGEKLGNKIANGKMMFIYQAQLAFKIWHNILPKIDKKLLEK